MLRQCEETGLHNQCPERSPALPLPEPQMLSDCCAERPASYDDDIEGSPPVALPRLALEETVAEIAALNVLGEGSNLAVHGAVLPFETSRVRTCVTSEDSLASLPLFFVPL